MRHPILYIDQGAGWRNLTDHTGAQAALATIEIEWGTDDPTQQPEPSTCAITVLDHTGALAGRSATLAGLRILIKLSAAPTWADLANLPADRQWQHQPGTWATLHRIVPTIAPAKPDPAAMTLFLGTSNTGGTVTRTSRGAWAINLKAAGDLVRLNRKAAQGPTRADTPGYHWTLSPADRLDEIKKRLDAANMPHLKGADLTRLRESLPPACAPYDTDTYPYLLTVLTDTTAIGPRLPMPRIYEATDGNESILHVTRINTAARIWLTPLGEINTTHDGVKAPYVRSALMRLAGDALEIPEPVTAITLKGKAAGLNDDGKTVSWNDSETSLDAAGRLPANLVEQEKTTGIESAAILADTSGGKAHIPTTALTKASMATQAANWLESQVLRMRPPDLVADQARFDDIDAYPEAFQPLPSLWTFTNNIYSTLLDDKDRPCLSGAWIATGGILRYDGQSRNLTNTLHLNPLVSNNLTSAVRWQDLSPVAVGWNQLAFTWADLTQVTDIGNPS